MAKCGFIWGKNNGGECQNETNDNFMVAIPEMPVRRGPLCSECQDRLSKMQRVGLVKLSDFKVVAEEPKTR